MKNLTATLCLTIVVLLGSVDVSLAQYHAKGIGLHTCGKILSDYDNGEKLHYFGRAQWVLGYITGRNYASNQKKGKDIDYDSIYYSIIKFCRENPFKSLNDSVIYLYESVFP